MKSSTGAKSDPLSVFLAHGRGQEEGARGPGENFSSFIDDFPFGIPEALGQFALPAPGYDTPALYGAKIVDLDLDGRAATPFRQLTEDRASEHTIEQREQHSPMDAIGAAHVFPGKFELERRGAVDHAQKLDSHVGREFGFGWDGLFAHLDESSAAKGGGDAATSDSMRVRRDCR